MYVLYASLFAAYYIVMGSIYVSKSLFPPMGRKEKNSDLQSALPFAGDGNIITHKQLAKRRSLYNDFGCLYRLCYCGSRHISVGCSHCTLTSAAISVSTVSSSSNSNTSYSIVMDVDPTCVSNPMTQAFLRNNYPSAAVMTDLTTDRQHSKRRSICNLPPHDYPFCCCSSTHVLSPGVSFHLPKFGTPVSVGDRFTSIPVVQRVSSISQSYKETRRLPILPSSLYPFVGGEPDFNLDNNISHPVPESCPFVKKRKTPSISVASRDSKLPRCNRSLVCPKAHHRSIPAEADWERYHSETPDVLSATYDIGCSRCQNLSLPNVVVENKNVPDPNIPAFYAPAEYDDLGDCKERCTYCNASFWYGERLKGADKNLNPVYHGCCSGGKVAFPADVDPPSFLKQLLQNRHYMENIRAYNQMFAMTSSGAKVDEHINNGHAPYVFKLSGQIYHWIGSMCPSYDNPPRFLQLYIYDTVHVVENRLRPFTTATGHSDLNSDIVTQLIRFLDTQNTLVKLFRTARDKCNDVNVPDFNITLYGQLGVRGYELPSFRGVGAIVFDDGPLTCSNYDVIIEQNRMDFLRSNQNTIRHEYLSGLYDAISKGDRDVSAVGSRVILPSSFTGGPRYMYNHYLDALAICCSLGNPQFFLLLSLAMSSGRNLKGTCLHIRF